MEGAIRRWLLPGFASSLLLIRDPFAFLIIFTAWKNRILRINIYISASFFIAFIGFFAAVLIGHANILVAIFGFRTAILHLPLIFIIAEVFDKYLLNVLCKFMVIVVIPMLMLIVIQFYSPQSSWINKAIYEGQDGAGFTGALGFFRPPGTFSFINGLSLFFITASSFVFYAILRPVGLPRWVVFASLICLLLSIPFSISRTLFFGIVLVSFFLLYVTYKSSILFWRIIIVGIIVFIAAGLLSENSLINTSVAAFSDRFNSANETEGGLEGVLLQRVLGGLVGAIKNSLDQPFWGFGIGMGTNVGAQLLSGNRGFLISEGEWGRLIGELGPLLGTLLILTRVLLSVDIAKHTWKSLKKGYLLPWLLLPTVIVNILIGQWAQPTSLGFSVFFGGVLLAATKNDPSNI